jgi:hypothetical protein
MSVKELVTPDVMEARLKMYYEETCFIPVPETIDGLPLRELAEEMAEAFEPPFATPEDFLLSPEEREEKNLWATVGEVDEFIERRVTDKEVTYV